MDQQGPQAFKQTEHIFGQLRAQDNLGYAYKLEISIINILCG